MKYKTIWANKNQKDIDKITSYFNLHNYVDYIEPFIDKHIEEIKIKNISVKNQKDIFLELTDGETIWNESVNIKQLLRLIYLSSKQK